MQTAVYSHRRRGAHRDMDVRISSRAVKETACNPQYSLAVGLCTPHAETRTARGGNHKLGLLVLSSFVVVGCLGPGSARTDPPNIDFGFPDFDGGVPFAGPQPFFGPTVSAPTPPPALSGGTLLLLKTGTPRSRLIPDRDLAYFVNLTTPALTSTVTLTAGDEPGRAVEDAAGKLHLVLRHAGVVAIIESGDGDGDRAQVGLPGAARHRVRRDRRSSACRLRRRRAGLAAGRGRRCGAHDHARARSA